MQFKDINTALGVIQSRRSSVAFASAATGNMIEHAGEMLEQCPNAAESEKERGSKDSLSLEGALKVRALASLLNKLFCFGAASSLCCSPSLMLAIGRAGRLHYTHTETPNDPRPANQPAYQV